MNTEDRQTFRAIAILTSLLALTFSVQTFRAIANSSAPTVRTDYIYEIK